MLRTITLGSAAIIAGVAYLIHLILQKCRELDGLPCPPMKNRLFGHLDIAGECNRLFPPAIHMQGWIPYLQKAYNQGDIFYIDWWPLGPRWIFIADPEVSSEYVTTGQSLPKLPLATSYLNVFLGKNNLLALEGQHWKDLRSIFNPGFSASHLMTLTPYIVDASVTFYKIICEKAESNELFEFEDRATRLTIDIIGKVVLDADLDSQTKTHPIVEAFRERGDLMPITSAVLDLSGFQLIRRYKVWRNGRKLDRLIGEELDRKMAARAAVEKQPKSFKDRKRSVIDLALDAYMKERSDNNTDKIDSTSLVMDKEFREDAIDSMKTFIFAGHDTTASTIAYVFYLLHFHPEVHKKMVKELDTVFSPGASTSTIADAIKVDPYIINKLEYITAVVKETLRVFPPASTLRYVPKESDPAKKLFITDPKTGKRLPLNGFSIWPAALLIFRNPRFFPSPAHFIPERFLPSQTPFPNADLFTPSGRDAWRPFEKGPRNCIGQELAMIEVKIILGLTVRDFDFVAEYDGVKVEAWEPVETAEEFGDGVAGRVRMTIEGHRCFQVLKGAAKPRGGLPGRISFRNSRGKGRECWLTVE